MANWIGGRLTKAGNDLQIKVEAGLCKLELTKIKLGDGTEGLDAIETMTDLVGPKAIFGISSVVAKDGMCTVTGVISSSNVTAAFYAREWGLFAKDPDRGEILYMNSLDPNPESIPPKTAALKQAATYAMNIVVSNAANITVLSDPAGLVNTDMLADGAGLVRRSTRYEMGDILYDTQLMRHDLRLECVRAGITAATLQDLSGVHLGDSVTDGTVIWRVKRLYTIDGDMFEIDEDGGIMPTAEPHYSVNYELDEDGNIMPKAMEERIGNIWQQETTSRVRMGKVASERKRNTGAVPFLTNSLSRRSK